jgi:2'-phosphotransferase
VNRGTNKQHQFKWNTLKSLKVTFPELKKVVETNAKKRFELAPIPPSPSVSASSPAPNAEEANLDVETSDAPSLASLSLQDEPDLESPSSWRIRATQGHSIDTVQSDSLLQPLDPKDSSTPRFVVHGTTPQSWNAIKASSGLSKMGRGHVHFATGTGNSEGDADTLKSLGGEDVTPGEEILQTHGVGGAKTEGPDGAKAVISGMRASSNILIWVDVRKSGEEGGLKWWRSANGVVLTEGDAMGMVPMEYVALVEKRKKGKKERQVFWPKEGGP